MITQLYDSLKPSHYQLTLDFDKETLTFAGSVVITAKMVEPSNSIRLHAKELTIESAQVNDKPAEHSLEDDDVLCLTTTNENSGDVLIKVTFSGVITAELNGIYPSYFEHNGKKKMLITTQFESHHARNAFPCIDEPAAKAVFSITTKTVPGEVILSNSEPLSQKEIDGKLCTEFADTPKMSTYLVAWVSGELHSRESKTKDGVTVRSWATVAQDASHLEFSVAEAVGYIEFYNDYFKTPYPLAKCDQIALPDFESGAMENWGLITYRETALLSDPENISVSTQQLVAIVVAHELSHQWFGNLVTMKWWDDLWLNESFASVIEYVAADNRHPEWNMWEDYVSRDCISATNRDVYKDVQAVRVNVESPSEIGTLFDPSIVYAKGGKLLKTLMDLLGEEAWCNGLAEYFKSHAYGNTTRDDLWNSLSKFSDINVPQFMNTWIEHAGQPLVSISQPKAGGEAELSQNRLLIDGATDDVVWQIPLLSNQDNTDSILFSNKKETLETNSWLQLNTSGVGHYIVNYKNQKHKLWLLKQLSDDKQSTFWKITRLNELIMLARANVTSLTEALSATMALKNEKSADVWSLIAHIIGSARQLIEGDEASESALKAYTFDLVKERLEELGWEYQDRESSNQTHLRSTIISLAIASENPGVIAIAHERYASVDSPKKLHPEARATLMTAVIKFDVEGQFDKLLEDYKTTNSAEYQSDINTALTATRDKKRANQLCDLLLYTETIRTQDTYRWFAYLMRNRHSREIIWNWLENNWEWIMNTFGSSKSYDNFARYGASFLNTDEWLQKYNTFFQPKSSDPSLKRTIAIGITEIKAKVQWRERDQEAISDWLKNLDS